MFVPEHTVTREGLFGYFCSRSDSETVINYLTNCQVSSELEHVHFLCHVASPLAFSGFLFLSPPFPSLSFKSGPALISCSFGLSKVLGIVFCLRFFFFCSLAVQSVYIFLYSSVVLY